MRLKFQPLKAAKTLFGYDAVGERKKRTAPRSILRSEDRELSNSDRKKLVSTARDQRRNMVLVAWMIRAHLDYVSRFTFQARNDNDSLNDQIERLVAWWSRPDNCDIAGRHNLQRFIRLAEAHRTIDGDIGILLTNQGRLQAIEGDRIYTPGTEKLPANLRAPDVEIENGVVLGSAGEAKQYIIGKRSKSAFGGESIEFERVVPARNLILHGYFDRFDQVRGITPLAPAINAIQDLYEGLEWTQLKVKLHALMGIAIKRGIAEETDGMTYVDTDTGESPTNATAKYDWQIQRGLMKFELDPGDEIDTIESKTPSAEFGEYTSMMIHLCLLALDLPITFFDSRKSSYSAQRQDLLRYIESAKSKRADNQAILDRILAWKLAQWSVQMNGDGRPLLALPGDIQLRDLKWEWISAGIPWIDPLKEINAYGKAIALGLKSRQQIAGELGLDWFETIRQLAEEEAEIVRTGVTVQVADPGATTTRDEETGNQANGERIAQSAWN